MTCAAVIGGKRVVIRARRQVHVLVWPGPAFTSLRKMGPLAVENQVPWVFSHTLRHRNLGRRELVYRESLIGAIHRINGTLCWKRTCEECGAAVPVISRSSNKQHFSSKDAFQSSQ